jgi:indole-3-glycerol phosphate synthase
VAPVRHSHAGGKPALSQVIQVEFPWSSYVSDVLAEICETKRGEIDAARNRTPAAELQARLSDADPPRDFLEALRSTPGIGLIAEVKKASPSAGVIREDFDPVAIAKTYESAGAACISCLTDEPYFQGRLEYLTAIRGNVSIPVMRKDFILDRYQVLEARVAGADCVLLIAECLNDCTMRDLYFYASELGMECLVEIYEPENLDRVLKLEAPLIGINNRNLKTFVTDLKHSTDLATQVPDSAYLVSESGIRERADVERLMEFGIRGILVGETLMRQDDIAAKAKELLET